MLMQVFHFSKMLTFIIDQVPQGKIFKMDASLYLVKVLAVSFTGIEHVLSFHLLWGLIPALLSALKVFFSFLMGRIPPRVCARVINYNKWTIQYK
jgi:hypothetical protein